MTVRPPLPAATTAPKVPAPKAPAPPLPIADRDRHTYLAPDVVKQRLEAGRHAEFHAGLPDPKVLASGPPKYFRTFEQVKDAMFELQKKYPNLVQVQDIGDSGDKVRGLEPGHDIYALRLTNRGAGAATDKPKVVYLGGEHAREIANPELLMRWADQTLAGYGRDPEATALLNTREIAIIPIMNPDGHKVVEQGYAQKNSGKLWQRKNTTPPAGTDLNRNYDFKWGGTGASSNPHSDTYRGAGPASEPEVQAVQNFVKAEKPAGFIDWHSYSELNLYPWGYTREKAPDHAGLDALAKKFSTYNHYTPQPSIELYPTTGTSKDWAYGTLRIPAFTVETGRSFHQSDAEFQRVWSENAPVMSYFAKVADAPFERVKGPDALDVHVARTARGGASLSAQVTDVDNGKHPIKAAEWVTDPSVAPGKGTPLQAADGAFNGVQELVRGTLEGVKPGQLVYVRAQDAQGNWGPATAQWAADTPAKTGAAR